MWKCIEIAKIPLKFHRIFIHWSEMILNKKTPEMNELEPVLKFLKIWAHNFENQKSCNQNTF